MADMELLVGQEVTLSVETLDTVTGLKNSNDSYSFVSEIESIMQAIQKNKSDPFCIVRAVGAGTSFVRTVSTLPPTVTKDTTFSVTDPVPAQLQITLSPVRTVDLSRG